MRRRAPRRLAVALERVSGSLAPTGLLGAVQRAWPEVVGPAVAREARPVSERAGTVTVACSSGVWAQELDLMAGELLPRLNEALPHGDAKRLRCLVGDPASRP